MMDEKRQRNIKILRYHQHVMYLLQMKHFTSRSNTGISIVGLRAKIQCLSTNETRVSSQAGHLNTLQRLPHVQHDEVFPAVVGRRLQLGLNHQDCRVCRREGLPVNQGWLRVSWRSG